MKSTDLVLKEVAAERIRQDAKWGEQNHPDFIEIENRDPNKSEVQQRMSLYGLPPADAAKLICDNSAKAGKLTYAHIAIEEVCEAFEEEPNSDKLREELVQTAAVFVAWIECIDRRRAGKMEKLELKAQELRVGDLFEYTGSFATYRVESEPKVDEGPDFKIKRKDAVVCFKHSRNGEMIGSGIRLAWDRSVTVWRKKEK